MTYDLPFGKNLTGAAAYAAKGWTLNSIYYAQTGIPITITSATNTSGLPVTERPNQGNCHLASTGALVSGMTCHSSDCLA